MKRKMIVAAMMATLIATIATPAIAGQRTNNIAITLAGEEVSVTFEEIACHLSGDEWFWVDSDRQLPVNGCFEATEIIDEANGYLELVCALEGDFWLDLDGTENDICIDAAIIGWWETNV